MCSNVRLTKKQESVLYFIEQFQYNNGSPPTYREIAGHFGYGSTKGAVDHVNALEKKGYVKCHRGRSRGIELLRSKITSIRNSVSVPIVGNIPAGRPEDQTEHWQGTFDIDQALLGGSFGHRLFILAVIGDSMTGRGIHDGDWVVVDADASPRAGDVVAALIDGENTLKTLAKKKGRHYLKAENPDHPDWIPVDEMLIQGIARAVLRRL